MTDTGTAEPDLARDVADDPPAAPPGSSEIPYDAGQRMWLGLAMLLGLLGFCFGLVALVISIVALDDDGGGGGAAPAPVVAEAGALDFVATEFAFDPDLVTVEAGEIEITVDNQGSIEHELRVLQEGTFIQAEEDFDESMELASILSLAAGDVGSTTVTLDPGRYQIVCLIPEHFASGMTGIVTAS